MTLRLQKGGKQKPWTFEEIEAGLAKFFEDHGRHPTAHEVDKYKHLPSARSIERSFGGLISVRKKLHQAESDFRIGEYSSKRSYLINERAHDLEQQVYIFLEKIFDKRFVHREYFFIDDKRTRADFFVYDSTQGFCVDVFYPASKRNLSGCLNIKLNKYSAEYMRQYPIIFLQMNKEICQEELDHLIKNKKRPLPKEQYLMAWDTFQQFCTSRKPLLLK